jgi:hypothetical protein
VSIDAQTVAERSGIDGFDLPLEGVSLVPIPRIAQRILGSNVQAITIVRRIAFNRQLFEQVVAGTEPELLAHELIHVAQWADHGIMGFTWDYVRDYLRLRFLGATHDAAYRSIRFEYQAYTGAQEINESLA